MQCCATASCSKYNTNIYPSIFVALSRDGQTNDESQNPIEFGLNKVINRLSLFCTTQPPYLWATFKDLGVSCWLHIFFLFPQFIPHSSAEQRDLNVILAGFYSLEMYKINIYKNARERNNRKKRRKKTIKKSSREWQRRPSSGRTKRKMGPNAEQRELGQSK